MICQCCQHESGEWEDINENFSECLHCHVYRNKLNLLEDRPIPRDIAASIDVQEVKSCVEKYSRVLLDLDRWYVQDGDMKSLYDVACGCGGMVWYARTRGWTTGGCDINLAHQRNAKEVLGVHIDIGFDDILFKAQYGCFVFHHGIEHVDSPRDTVEKALHNLKQDGIIYFQHPVMPEGTMLLANKGHQYEWTWRAFDIFIKQFPVDVCAANCGEYNGGPGVPSQTWIVRKK